MSAPCRVFLTIECGRDGCYLTNGHDCRVSPSLFAVYDARCTPSRQPGTPPRCMRMLRLLCRVARSVAVVRWCVHLSVCGDEYCCFNGGCRRFVVDGLSPFCGEVVAVFVGVWGGLFFCFRPVWGC